MLAVRAGIAEVEKIIAAESLDLVVANRNAPKQIVLSGATSEIERAAEVLRVRQIDAQRLPVSAAFHSPLVSEAEAPLAAALKKIQLGEGTVPVYANTTGKPYPADAKEAKALLAGQLARPVLFEELIRQMHEDGVRTFVETGPHARLTGLVTSVLDGDPHHAFALDASHGSRSGIRDLARVLAQIGSLGHTIDLQPWDASFRPTAAPATAGRAALTYRVGGANIRTRKREAMPRDDIKTVQPATGQGAPNMNQAPTQSGAPAPPPAPVAPATAPVAGSVAEALRVTQENMAALQRLQQQTAHLHQQFLEGQNASQQHYHTLLRQQQRFLDLSMGLPVSEVPPVTPAVFSSLPAISIPAPTTPVAPATVAVDSHAAPETQAPVVTEPPAESVVPAAEPALAPATAAAEPGVDVAKILLDIVSEKTGYPTEVLELRMELDSDLGIDSIKRVEILSALQDELPNAPKVGPDQLGTLRTLQSLLDLIPGQGSEGAPPQPTPAVAVPAVTSEAGIAPATAAAEPGVDVAKILLDIVADKTGYPTEVLEFRMELDSDLGIDSIKRVEILSALQDVLPDAPKVGPDQLGTLRTLQSLLDLIPGQRSEGAPPQPAPTASNGTRTAAVGTDGEVREAAQRPLQRYLLRSRDFNGAVEEDVARPAAGAPIWITEGDAALASEIVTLLESDGYAPRVVSAKSLNGSADEPVVGVVILPPRNGASDEDLLDVLQVVQAAGKGLRTAGQAGGAFLVSASRLDGAFGTTGNEIADPLSGGFAGLTKSAASEWPEVRCRALDLAPDLQDADAASAIVAELFRAGPMEVGLSAAGRSVLELVGGELPSANGSLPLSEGDVVVLSGGARGVTAEVALALANSCRPTLALLGRSPEPEAEPEWLAALASEAEIKKAVLARGDATSPREAGEIYKRVRAEREIRTNLERISATGATVRYMAVDVRDSAAVSEALSSIREDFGPIRILVHGAGVLADQHILDKTAENFQRVYEPKVAGLRNLLNALDRDALRALVLFSSSTARYGRIGQVDYAIANEVLNKVAQQEARRLPDCRVLSLNWGPWEGGMVDESLRAVFKNEGVPLIPLAQGADHLLRELAAADSDVERIVLGPNPNGSAGARGTDGLESNEPVVSSTLPLVAEEKIDVASCSFLHSHVLDGKAVVPLAMLPEWLAHGALHGNPGLKFYGCDNLRLLKGLVLDADSGLLLRIHAGVAHKDEEGTYRVPVELRARQDDGKEFLHARADILLTESLPTGEARLSPPQGSKYEKTAAETYRDHLFHGPALQGIERVQICSPEGVIADASAAPPPSEWMDRPFRRRWLTDPLALDVGIQLLTFWTGVHSAGPSLPCAVASYRQYRAFPKDGTHVVARITESDDTRVFADVEFLDADGQLVARFEGCENTIDEELTNTFRSNQLPLGVSP